VLRGNESYLATKLKALENLGRMKGAKVALMSCVAIGFNDHEMPDLLKFCHERRHFIRGVYFMPLAQTWETDEFDLEADRVTNEDLEILLSRCFPEERIDFVPAGVLGELKALMKCLNVPPPPFAGAHPNCESMYVLVSNGEEYVPLSRYLKGATADFVNALLAADARMARKTAQLESGSWGRLLAKLGLRRKYLSVKALAAVVGALRRNVRFGKLLRGRGLGKLWHLLAALGGLLRGLGTREVMQRHSTWQGIFQIIVLPFEDDSTLETERLERCPNAFVYYDPAADRVNYVPTCAWSQHKVPVMKRIAAFYEKSVKV
jgi:hypothetical protein